MSNFRENWMAIQMVVGIGKYKKQKKMDMERPLKFEGEYFGIETDSDFNQCFPDNFVSESYAECYESSHLNTRCDLPAHIIDRIRLSRSIALTPMAELIQIARQEQAWDGETYAQLRRTLRKTKLIQKRQRAKNRTRYQKQTQAQAPKAFEVVSVDRSEDIKKQKNRLSAQISRDRKKQHYLKLELENQELRKALNELNRTNAELQTKVQAGLHDKKKEDNPGKSLLILLGIIFLLNLIRGAGPNRQSKAVTRAPISKVGLSSQEQRFVHSELTALGIEIPDEIMQKSRTEMMVDRNLGNQLASIRLGLF